MSKILIANSVGKDDLGNKYILFPSRWSACVGKVKSFNYYPYQLAYLSSLLKKETKNEVKMVDGNFLDLNWQEYFEKYKSFRPDILVMETSSLVYKQDLKFALCFKKKYGTKLIFAGQHPTAYPKEVMNDGTDYVCLGEYEMTVLDIVMGKNRRSILGLYPNKPRPLLDINKLPLPEDNDISRINYSQIGGCDYKEVEIFASRGCPNNCNFCVARQVYYAKPNWRQRNIKSVIDEIKYLVNKYDEIEGLFFDEEFHNANKQYVLDLCSTIVKNKLNYLKIDAMCGYWTLDRQMLKAMKMAGYYKLRIGIESISKDTAKGMRKNINKDMLIKVLKIAKSIGIKMYGTFTFGIPGSTAESDSRSLDFLEEMLKKNLLDDFQVSICTPQPGTPFFEYLDKNGLIYTKDWSKYDGNNAVFEYSNYKKNQINLNMVRAKKIYFRNMIRKIGIIKLVFFEFKRTGIKGLLIKTKHLLFDKVLS